jgi:hypothetical protein
MAMPVADPASAAGGVKANRAKIWIVYRGFRYAPDLKGAQQLLETLEA